MSKLPVLSAKDVMKILVKFGFQVYRQSGSHIHLWNGDKKIACDSSKSLRIGKRNINFDNETSKN